MLGQKFLIVTYDRALAWLYKETDGMIARWLKKIGQFHFEIKHEARKKTPQADCSSKVPTTTEEVVNQIQKTSNILTNI